MAKRFANKNIPQLLSRFEEKYGDVDCALDHRNPYELTAATILSAQCTDKRVNMVTPALFEKYPTPKHLAEAKQEDVEALVRSTGFYRNKAKNLIGMGQRVVLEHGGEIPEDFDALVKLPGVARKTANVVMGVAFKVASGVVVDTHVGRISRLIGLTKETDPVKVERELVKKLPKEAWIKFSHMLIQHGRDTCIARRPQCGECFIADLCGSAGRVG